MVNKRKRDDLIDSDSEEVTPGKQILPVANLPHDFDQEPQDGMQYLFLVRRDARRLPRVTRVPNPYELPGTRITDTFTSSCTNVLPCEEWRIAFQAHFYNLRKNLVQATIHVDHDHPDSKRRIIPEKKDREAWWKFLAGYPESAWSPKDRSVQKKPGADISRRMGAFAHSPAAVFPVDATSQPRDESVQCQPVGATAFPGSVARQLDSLDPPRGTEQGNATPFTFAAPMGQAQEDGTEKLSPPQVTPSRLREVDHKMSIHLLMYFAHWINIHLQNPSDPLTSMSASHGQWIFALLTKIEDRLSADEMNLMRNLARACLGLIQKHRIEHAGDTVLSGGVPGSVPVDNTMRMSDTSCWIVFAAVAGYWGQRDLWADAEAILSASA